MSALAFLMLLSASVPSTMSASPLVHRVRDFVHGSQHLSPFIANETGIYLMPVKIGILMDLLANPEVRVTVKVSQLDTGGDARTLEVSGTEALSGVMPAGNYKACLYVHVLTERRIPYGRCYQLSTPPRIEARKAVQEGQGQGGLLMACCVLAILLALLITERILLCFGMGVAVPCCGCKEKKDHQDNLAIMDESKSWRL